MSLSIGPILWEGLPVEVLRPFGEIKCELESHVGGESNEIIQVVRREDTSDMGVGANIEGSDLVAAVYKVGAWQNLGFFQQFIDV